MREDLYEEAFARMKKAAGVSGTANCNLTKLKRISGFKNKQKLFRLLLVLSKVNEVGNIVHPGLDDRTHSHYLQLKHQVAKMCRHGSQCLYIFKKGKKFEILK